LLCISVIRRRKSDSLCRPRVCCRFGLKVVLSHATSRHGTCIWSISCAVHTQCPIWSQRWWPPRSPAVWREIRSAPRGPRAIPHADPRKRQAYDAGYATPHIGHQNGACAPGSVKFGGLQAQLSIVDLPPEGGPVASSSRRVTTRNALRG
jgi:hypothetical protein